MKKLMFARMHTLLVGLLFAVGAAPSAVAAELPVPSQYPTIQAAINASLSGDTIRIAAGNYDEQPLIVDKANLTLAGEPGTVIRATNAMTQTLLPYGGATTYPLLAMVRSQVVFTGLTFDGMGLGDSYPNLLYGIVFRGSSGQVTNCTVRGFRGVTGTDARGLNVVNLVNLGTPVVNVDIVNNTFADNRRSVVLSGDVGINSARLLRTTFTVEGNTFTGLGPGSTTPHYGISVFTGAGGEVKLNTMTGYSYRGTNTGFSSAIVANDGSATASRGYLPVQPVRYVNNTFITNDHHLVMMTANDSQVVSNIFQGVGPGWLRWGGLALSGTNVLVAHNEFSDMPIGIELFGGESNGPILRGVATNPRILSNDFCRVPQPIRAQPLANGLQEQGTEICTNQTIPRDLHVPAQYLTIQAAVDAAASGDTIRIAAGDYFEQIVIANKNRLNVTGEPGAVLHATNAMTETLLPFGWSFVPLLGIFRSDVVVSNLVFDGHRMGNVYNGFFGVYSLGSSGQVENCTVRGFRGPTGPTYGAAGFRTQNAVSIGTPPVTASVFNSTFEDNESSIHIRGEPVLNPTLLRTTFAIEGNTITGIGPSDAPFDGIAIRNGATGVVKGNTIKNYSHPGAGDPFASGITAYDDNARTRTPPIFVPLLPVRYEGNTFSNNDEHLVLIGANESQVVNNTFHGSGPDGPRWGALALSGTNILVANNDFSNMPTGIVMFADERLFAGWPTVGVAANPKLEANWFCNVVQAIPPQPLATGLQEQGTAECPFRPTLQSLSPLNGGGMAFNLRSWHGQSVIIEASTDLLNWLPIHTNAMTLPSFKFEDGEITSALRRFFRAVQR